MHKSVLIKVEMAQNIQLSFLVVLLESVVEFEINILFEINAKWLVGANFGCVMNVEWRESAVFWQWKY